MKYLIIDSRMRKIEKEYFENLGYKLIKIMPSNKTYPEISSHVDIFTCKTNNTIFVEKSKFKAISSRIDTKKVQVSDRRE